MASPTSTRPIAVTAFGWLVVLGSVFLVFTAFEQVASLSSLESRRGVEEFLSEPPGDGLGIGLEATLDLLHVLSVVAGGCAAGAAVLGFFALRRHKNARLGLTVLAVPIFVAGLALGGFLSAMVAVGTVALWMGTARDWFNGIDPPPRPPGSPFGGPGRGKDQKDQKEQKEQKEQRGWGGPRRRRGEDEPGPTDDEHRDEDEQAARRERQPATQGAGTAGSGREPGVEPATRPVRPMRDPVAGASSGARAYVGFGGPGSAPAGEADPQADTGPAPSPHGNPQPRWTPTPGGPARPARPTPVLVACVLTWATCAVVGALMLGIVVALAASPDMLIDAVLRENPELGDQVGRSTLVGSTIGLGVVVLLWCAAAAVVAIFVLRGQAWARLTLAVSATVACVGSAVLATGSAALLVPMIAAGATAYCLLFRPEVRAWFARA